MAGVFAGPSGFGEKPGDQQGGEKLEPKREGVAQAFDTGSANADGRAVLKKEEGADADAAGTLLKKMNQENDWKREKCEESVGVGEMQKVKWKSSGAGSGGAGSGKWEV